MARTVLRSRSGDIVTAVRLADRTGIVAASAPPADLAPESSDGRGRVLVELAEPGARAGAWRRVRGKMLFVCAAAGFLVIGWLGGGAFARHDADTAPAVAADAVVHQQQSNVQDAAPAPVTTSAAPQPPGVAPPPAKETGKKQAAASESTRVTRKQATGSSAPPTTTVPHARMDPTSPMLSTGQNSLSSMRSVLDQFQQLIDSWQRSGYGGYSTYLVMPYGHNSYGQGR
jgi:hypothetical protein